MAASARELPANPLGPAAVHAGERLGLGAAARLHRGALVDVEPGFGRADLVGCVFGGVDQVISGWTHDGAPRGQTVGGLVQGGQGVRFHQSLVCISSSW